MSSGKGTTLVEYYGNIYQHALTLKNFRDIYDKRLDLFITCNKCASNKYYSFKKIKPNG